MRTERFEQRKLKKCLKKIQDLPVEIQLEKLTNNGVWMNYAEEHIKNLFSDLKQLVESGHATGRQLHFYGSWSYSDDDEDKKSVYGEYLSRILPTDSDDFETWWSPSPSRLKYLCLSAKKRYAPAIYDLSCFYYDTRDISGHREISERLMNIASKLNYPDALRDRAYLNYENDNLIRELQRVAALGSDMAMLDLIHAYKTGSLYGLAIVKKNQKLVKFYERRRYME